MDVEQFLKNEKNERIATLTEEDVALFENIGSPLQNENIRSEAYVAILCLEGKAVCQLNDRTYEVGKNDVFLCHPNLFLENAMASFDFDCRGMLMSPKLFDSMLQLSDNMLDAQMIICHEPVVHLEPEEAQIMLYDFDILNAKLQAPPLPHRKEIIQHLLQTMIYEFFDCIAPKLQLDKYNYTSAESLYRRFIKLVMTETPRHRDVQYYASRLCVTPKYLSAVCKQQTGKTAAPIINRHAAESIRLQLRNSTKSVKEIAIESGFDNLSFFGKYVLRTFGMSPRDYRKNRDEQPGEE